MGGSELERSTRRQFFRTSGVLGLGMAMGSGLRSASVARAASAVSDPDEALHELLEGNRRYVEGHAIWPNQDGSRRAEVAAGQHPFALIFSCVDSRVPPEIVFDRGLGDLFVIRTAGHVGDRAALGSIEYGIEELHIPLVVVLGHERCGAVVASIEAVDAGARAPGDIATLVEGIRPAVDAARGLPGDRTDNTVRANVQHTVQQLDASPILHEAWVAGHLKIVGARYDLDSGLVEIITPAA
jgi:carbonic anhydrase